MAYSTYRKNRKQIQVTFSEKDVQKEWGKDVPLSKVQHWIEMGIERERYQEKNDKRNSSLDESLKELHFKLERLAEEQEKITKLLLRTARLLSHISTAPHYQLELLRIRSKGGSLNEHDANQKLLVEIKEENFRNYVERDFPGYETDLFLETGTKKDDQ